jgi:hypothetical protein
MRPDKRFLRQPKSFWALVRSIGEAVGYTGREKHDIKVPKLLEMRASLEKLGLNPAVIIAASGNSTELGETLSTYFKYRARILNTFVEPHLMNDEQARKVFTQLRQKLSPRCPIPTNKQTGEKKAPAYFTGIINMLIEAHSEGLPCDYDPRRLTTVTINRVPLRTLARRVDGAFTSTVNPIAVWEIKEYYYTATFGSRVADGIYETLLDGMELEELREHEGVDVEHYLMVDAHYTWWDCGRSYLCRILDMLHMGYIDEALFGAEVLERMPTIVKDWAKIAKQRNK